MQVDDSSDSQESNSHTYKTYIYGKKRYKWAKHSPRRRRKVKTPDHNLITHLLGLKGQAILVNMSTLLDA